MPKRFTPSYLRRLKRRAMQRTVRFGPGANFFHMNNNNHYNNINNANFNYNMNNVNKPANNQTNPNNASLINNNWVFRPILVNQNQDIYSTVNHPLVAGDPRISISKRPQRVVDPLPDLNYQTKIIPLESVEIELNIKSEPDDDVILLNDYDKREAQLKKLSELNQLEEQIRQSLNYIQTLKENLIRQMLL